MLESGGSVPSQTRTYDVASGRTVLLRYKETALDYRFMPEPDLPPLVIPQAVLDELKRTTPELPAATAARFGLLPSHTPHARRVRRRSTRRIRIQYLAKRLEPKEA